MSFSFRNLHNIISGAYHFIFNDPYLFKIINELDQTSYDDIIKLLTINGIDHLTKKHNSDVLSRIRSVEEKSIIDFCSVIKSLIFENILNFNNRYCDIIMDRYIDIDIYKRNFIESKIINYYILGFFYENYVEKYNKIISKINIINERLRLLASDTEDDGILLKGQKDDMYILLINDFIIDLSTKFYDDIILNFIKNVFLGVDYNEEFKNRMPFAKIYSDITESKNLLKSHNENIQKLLTEG